MALELEYLSRYIYTSIVVLGSSGGRGRQILPNKIVIAVLGSSGGRGCRRLQFLNVSTVLGSSGGRGLAWERGGAGGEHVPEDWKGSDRDEDGMAADTGRAEKISQLGEMGENGRRLEDA